MSFKERMQALLTEMRELPLAPGFDRVTLPGDDSSTSVRKSGWRQAYPSTRPCSPTCSNSPRKRASRSQYEHEVVVIY